MTRDLAIVNTSQIVTLAGPQRPRVGAELRELAIVPQGAMLVRDGRIAASLNCRFPRSSVPISPWPSR